MPPTPTDRHRSFAFGAYLKQLRDDLGLTLRDVEEETKKQVSNAYLSQLENGKINEPSPSILYVLSPVYKVPYEKLMVEAGYLSRPGVSRHTTRNPTYAVDGLSPDEQRALRAYLQVLRREQRKSST